MRYGELQSTSDGTLKTIMGLGRGANAIVEERLAEFLKSIESDFDADVLAYAGPIALTADDRIKDAIETLRRRKRRLLLSLKQMAVMPKLLVEYQIRFAITTDAWIS